MFEQNERLSPSGPVASRRSRSVSASRAMDDGAAWRRAALDYNAKFRDDYVVNHPDFPDAPPLRLSQAPSASAAVASSSSSSSSRDRRLRRRSPVPTNDDADDADAADPIPATGFTIWDAGILLGMYVTRPRVWARLLGDAARDDAIVLELGAGTGVAGLLVACTGSPALVGMTDLPALVPFLRENARRNKAGTGTGTDRDRDRDRDRGGGGAIPANVLLAV